jgi:hypothetical protein
VAQQRNLAIEATQSAIGAGVIESPVSVDEAEDCAPFVLAEKTVVFGQPGEEFRNLLNEPASIVVVVMQMHFHIRHAEAHDFGDPFYNLALILFLGIKEAVLWLLSGRIARRIASDTRPPVAPSRNSLETGFK